MCRFWCFPTGQTPCCIHTEQPDLVLTLYAGCHLEERGQTWLIVSLNHGTICWIISRFDTHWWLLPQVGSPPLEPCPRIVSLDYPHNLTSYHCLLQEKAGEKKAETNWMWNRLIYVNFSYLTATWAPHLALPDPRRLLQPSSSITNLNTNNKLQYTETWSLQSLKTTDKIINLHVLKPLHVTVWTCSQTKNKHSTKPNHNQRLALKPCIQTNSEVVHCFTEQSPAAFISVNHSAQVRCISDPLPATVQPGSASQTIVLCSNKYTLIHNV